MISQFQRPPDAFVSTVVDCNFGDGLPVCVHACSFHPSGTQIVCTLDRGLMILKSATSGSPISQWRREIIPELRSFTVLSCDWSEDGTILAMGRRQKGVALLLNGNQFCDTKKLQTVDRIKWNKKGSSHLFLAASGRLVTVWNVSKLSEPQELAIHSGSINDLEWISEDTFASCSFKRIHLCRVGMAKPIRTFPLDEKIVWSIRYHPQMHMLMGSTTFRLFQQTRQSNDTIHIWSLGEDQYFRKIDGHSGSVYCLSCIDCSQGTRQKPLVASGSADRTVRIWSLADPQHCRILDGHSSPVKDVAFSPDGKYLASLDSSGAVVVWSTEFWVLLFHCQTEAQLPDAQRQLIWNNSSDKLLISRLKGHIRVIERNDTGDFDQYGEDSTC